MIAFWAAILVLASIGVVAWPLLRGIEGRNRLGLAEDPQIIELLAEKDATLLAISELESDYSMGNLSQRDYGELRQKYEEKAFALLKTVDELRSERGGNEMTLIDEDIEIRVAELRTARDVAEPERGTQASKVPGGKHGRQIPIGKSCPGCGARLDAEDLFCFRCGTALSLRCPDCSAAVDPGDRFCSHCGMVLTTRGNDRKGG